MTEVSRGGGPIVWQPWASDSFARAAAGGRRVLLWLGTSWSAGCDEMSARSYSDPAVIAEIDAHYVPVRVDADARPDLAERYDLGGWPTTAVLEADGTLVGGGTFVPPDRLVRALVRLAAAHAPLPSAGAVSRQPTPADQDLFELVMGYRDDEHGGCGPAPKFPHPAPVRLALASPAGSAEHAWALRTLDAMGSGGLSRDDGGFYRYCERADWTMPRRETLLPVNGALVHLFADAALSEREPRFAARAASALTFIERELRRPDGTWRFAAGGRPTRVVTDANAATVSALLRLAAVQGDAELARRAITTLDDLLLATYRPGEGVAHIGGGIRGLLTDTVAMASACLDAWDAAAQLPHRMMAEELMHFAVRTMWDPDREGFFDRSASLQALDPVPLAPLRPFVSNCEAALVMARLAHDADDPSWALRARATLDAMAPAAIDHGPLAAHYLLASSAIGG